MDYLADALVIGLSEQGPLALAAMGLALIYYLNGIINVAYAETITLGAYFGMWANTTLGLNFYGSIVVAGALAGGLSVATYLLVFRPAAHRRVGTLEVIIISFGLSVFLRHGLQFVFGYLDRFYDVPPPTYTSVLGVGVTTFQITAMALVIALGVGLYLFIQRTDPGQRIRALASDAQLAEVSGIDPRRVTVLIWLVAGRRRRTRRGVLGRRIVSPTRPRLLADPADPARRRGGGRSPRVELVEGADRRSGGRRAAVRADPQDRSAARPDLAARRRSWWCSRHVPGRSSARGRCSRWTACGTSCSARRRS